MKSWLVTGGAGFIGANFVLGARASLYARVINLDLLTYAGHRESLVSLTSDPDHVFVHGDIGDLNLVARLLREFKPTAIVNFAAESHVDRSILGPDAFVRTNVTGTHNLLRAALDYWKGLDQPARRDFRFLHVSTDEVYGTLGPGDAPFTEEHRYQPNSPYAASKAAADHLVRAYFHTYGLPTLTTNCSNNYGPFQFPEKLIPLMIQNARAGKPLPVYGDGRQVRDWLYVEDHCDAIRTVLAKGAPGETYNVGGGNERVNMDVVNILCELMDELAPAGAPHARLIRHVADRPGHDRRYAIDGSKLRRELGWTAATPFETGIRHTVEWYLAHDDWIAAVSGAAHEEWVAANYTQREGQQA
jgi:dTDP-glucose 4,6-dehydratase